MKQAMNFRLSGEAAATLMFLEEELHVSKTAIIESALRAYAKHQLKANNPLLPFLGVFSEDDAENILSAIKSSRKNKKIKVEL